MEIGSNTNKRVVAALNENGYRTEDDEFISCVYAGLNPSNHEMHTITFVNDDTGKQDTGTVFVWNEGGKLLADY